MAIILKVLDWARPALVISLWVAFITPAPLTKTTTGESSIEIYTVAFPGDITPVSEQSKPTVTH